MKKNKSTPIKRLAFFTFFTCIFIVIFSQGAISETYSISDSPDLYSYESNTLDESSWTELPVADIGNITDWSITYTWITDQWPYEGSFYVKSPSGTEFTIATEQNAGTYTIQSNNFDGENLNGTWLFWIQDSYGDGGHQALEISLIINFDFNDTAPSNFLAQLNNQTVNLSWNAPATPGDSLQGYNVYRDNINLTGSPITQTNYDDNLTEYATYCYQIKAIYTNSESNPTNEICITNSPPGTYPITDSPSKYSYSYNSYNEKNWAQIPVNEQGGIGNWTITYTWLTDVWSYEGSFHALSPAGTEFIIGQEQGSGTYSISSSNFNGETAAGTWKLWVEDSYGDGGHQATNIIMTIETVDILDMPTNLDGIGITDSIKLTWNAPGNTIGLTGYNIYRDDNKINPSPISDTCYIDVNLNQDTYCYSVKAIYGDDEGSSSNQFCHTIYPPGTYGFPDSPGPYDYNSNTYTEWAWAEINVGEQGNIANINLSYYWETDFNIEESSLHLKYIRENDSLEITVAEAQWAGFYEIELDDFAGKPADAKFLLWIEDTGGDGGHQATDVIMEIDVDKSAPTNLQGAPNQNNVQLSWEAPIAGPIDALHVGYKIYRNDLLIGEPGLNPTTYTDENLLLGIYTYYVTSRFDNGSESAPSNPVIIESYPPGYSVNSYSIDDSPDRYAYIFDTFSEQNWTELNINEDGTIANWSIQYDWQTDTWPYEGSFHVQSPTGKIVIIGNGEESGTHKKEIRNFNGDSPLGTWKFWIEDLYGDGGHQASNITINISSDETRPRNLQGTPNDNSVALIWSPPISLEDLVEYNIYRDDVKINTSTITDTTYTDENIIDGIYSYSVTSLLNDNKETGISNKLSVVVGQSALNFDGSGNYVDIGSAGQNLSEITLEAWVNTDDFSSFGSDLIISKYAFDETTSIEAGWQLGLRNFLIIIEEEPIWIELMIDETELNEWNHFAGTFDGDSVKYYINGQLMDYVEISGSITNPSTNTFIGKGNDREGGSGAISGMEEPPGTETGSTYNGKIDEVRIWDYARTETEIQSTMNTELIGNESGLIGYWPFSEGTGDSTMDQSNNDNNGIIHGAKWTLGKTVGYPPKNLLATSGVDSINLTWSPPEVTADLVGYNIHRNGTKINTTIYTDTSYVDIITPGTYIYKIAAIYSDGSYAPSDESKASSYPIGTTFTQRTFPIPNSPDPYLYSYNSYDEIGWTDFMVQSQGTIESWSITYHWHTDFWPDEGSVWIQSPSGTQARIASSQLDDSTYTVTSTSFTGDQMGGIWRIWIQDTYGDGGHFMTNISMTINCALSTSILPEAYAEGTTINLSWNRPEVTENLSGYNIDRDDIKINLHTILPADTTYTDEDMLNGTYCYTVSAIYDTIETAKSNAACATIQIFTPVTEISQILNNVYYPSVDWGDYDNDGDLDILLAGEGSQYEPITKIYRNDGNDTFTDIQADLTGVRFCSLDWGDYDNDGDLDFILMGEDEDNHTITTIYRNDGNNQFGQIYSGLTNLKDGDVHWGDYDNDGDLDILIMGKDNSNNSFTTTYRNESNDIFTEINGGLPDVSDGSLAWGDYDRDGDLDILLTGGSVNVGLISRVYRNNGNYTFTDIEADLTGTQWGSAAWGDFDSDGDLDILLGGWTYSGYISKIYQNNGNDIFQDINSTIPGLDGKFAWADFDNDGDLDILKTDSNATTIYRNDGLNTFINNNDEITGIENGVASWGDYDNDSDLDILIAGSATAKVYKNQIQKSNTIPTSPNTLQVEIQGTSAILKWNQSTDSETPSKGLTYNLRIGTTSGGSQILSPMAASDGFREVPQMGNVTADTIWTIKNLDKGLYYTSVQSIDNTFTGSPFSTEVTFEIFAPENLQASIDGNAVTLTWDALNIDGLTGYYVYQDDEKLVDTPIASTTFLHSNLSAGSYCYTVTAAYNTYETAHSNEVCQEVMTNFSHVPSISAVFYDVFSGSVDWGDYDSDGDMDILLTGAGIATIYHNNGNDTFSDIQTVMYSAYESSADWGDYDNDGDLDILLNGLDETFEPYSVIYRNDGNDTFMDIEADFTGLAYGSCQWGDYNNDGKPDALLCGLDENDDPQTLLYRNYGNDIFIPVEINVIDIWDGIATFADYDNDSDLDILVTGDMAYSEPITKIYQNNGNGNFVDISASLIDLSASSAAWGDYDNDGDLDILMIGYDGEFNQYTSTIFSNDNLNGFTEISTNFIGLINGCTNWLDYDNDGDLDAFISGQDENDFPQSILYQNQGNDTFIDAAAGITNLQESQSAWGDFDNDEDLDLIIFGKDVNDNQLTKIYRNKIETLNTPPSYPDDLSVYVEGSTATLSWNGASDSQTATEGLSYNLSIGTNPTWDNVLSPASKSNGYRKVVELGNVNQTTTWKINNLPGGTFYWSVQGIDASFNGSPFAPENSFEIHVYPPQNLSATIEGNSVKLNWSEPTTIDGLLGYNIYRNDTKINTEISTDTTYIETGLTAQEHCYTIKSVFNLGESAPSNRYCVEVSPFTKVEIASEILDDLFFSAADWGDYDNDGDLDILLTGGIGFSNKMTEIYRNDGNDQFTDMDVDIEGFIFCSVQWGDYDNDNDLDILLTGLNEASNPTSAIYRNDENAVFTDIEAKLHGIEDGHGSWADYDNDGDLDVLITGSGVSKIYRNDGNDTFTSIQSGLTRMEFSCAQWSDYDNDGDLDILLMGKDSSNEPTSKIFKNTNGTFSDIQADLIGVAFATGSWGDYDGDGDQDILIAGFGLSKIYRNDGNDDFVLIEAELDGIDEGYANWGDYDNDGDLDIILIGNFTSEIYRNDSNDIFTPIDSGLQGIGFGQAAWGDFDMDSDLDILLTGWGNNGLLSQLFKNNTKNENSPPTPPVTFPATVDGGTVNLTWSAGTDLETPTTGLTYNLRIGTSLGGSEIISPAAIAMSGTRQLAKQGNVGTNTSWKIQNLESGRYYWSVQTIDNSFAPSDFAMEGSFDVLGPTNLQATTNYDYIDLTWELFDGAMLRDKNFSISKTKDTSKTSSLKSKIKKIESKKSNLRSKESAINNRQLENLMGYKIYRGTTLVDSVPPEVTSYTDYNLNSGQYCYHIVGIFDGTNGASSNTACDIILLPPQNLNSSQPDANIPQIQLNWTPLPMANGLDGYNIYRGLDKINSIPITTNSYVDTLSGGGYFCYTVTVVVSGVESGISNEACSILTIPPSSLAGEAIDDLVEINWESPPIDNSFAGYNIYRNSTQLNVYPILESFYTDTAPINGTNCYTIKSIFSGQESVQSNELCFILGPSALQFDGQNHYVNCGTGNGTWDMTNQLTIEGWIYAYSWKDSIWDGAIIAKDKITPVGFALACGDNGTLGFRLGKSNQPERQEEWISITTPKNSLYLNSWHHVVGVFDEEYLKIYIDGEERGSFFTPGIFNYSTSPLLLGSSNGGSGKFHGKIDEVRLWNTALSQNEIQNNMNIQLNGTEDGLVGYWKMDEGNGEIIQDETQFFNTGNILGATWTEGIIAQGSPPANLVADAYGNEVILIWEPPNISEGLLGYNIYKDSTLLTPEIILDNIYVDSQLEEGEYCYQVASVYEAGHTAYSNKICATIGGSLSSGEYPLNDSPEQYSYQQDTFDEWNWTTVEITDDRIIEGWSITYTWLTDEFPEEGLFYVSSPMGTTYPIGQGQPSATYTVTTDIFNGENALGMWSLWIIDTGFNGGHQAIEVTMTLNYAPDRLEARVDRNSVILNWNDIASRTTSLLGYNIYRNGEPINEELILKTTFVDENLSDGNYSYELQGVWEDSQGVFFNEAPVSIYKNGYATTFDGIDDYAQIQNEDNFDFSNALTIEIWIKIHQSDLPNQKIISKGDSWSIKFNPDTNLISFNTNHFDMGFHHLQSEKELYENRWHHIVAIFDGNSKRLYIDGNFDSTKNIDENLIPNDVPVTIGSLFCGAINELRLWNTDRPSEQIKLNLTTYLHDDDTENLMGYWRMDNGVGNIIYDFSGNDNDGILHNGATWTISTTPLATRIPENNQNCVGIWENSIHNSSSVLHIRSSNISGNENILFAHHPSRLSPNRDDIPSGILRRLDRFWQVQISGNPTGQISFDCSNLGIEDGENLRILASDSPIFSQSDVILGMYDGANYLVNYHNFGQYKYYTLATISENNFIKLSTVDVQTLQNLISRLGATIGDNLYDYGHDSDSDGDIDIQDLKLMIIKWKH